MRKTRRTRKAHLAGVVPRRTHRTLVLTLAPLVPLLLTVSVWASTECSDELAVGGDDDYDDWGVSLDIARDGVAWVVWMGRDPVDEDEEVYFTKSTEGGWSERQRLHEQNSGADRFPRLSIGADGVGWVVWYQSDSGGSQLCVSHGGEAGWSEPDSVHLDANRYDDKDICAIDSTDVWVATATNVSGEEHSVILTYHWQGTAWEGPWQIGMPGYANDYPEFGVDQLGRAWLVWFARSPTTAMGPILASTWTGTGWSDYEVASDDSLNGGFPHLAFDGDVPVVIWVGNYNTTVDIKYSRFEGGSWTPEGLVSLPDSVDEWDYNPTCATNRAGTMAVVWEGGDNSDVFSPAVYMSWWEGSSWTPERQVSNDDPYTIDRFPSGAVDEYGGLWIAWQHYLDTAWPYDSDIRASICTRTTPVPFGAVTASVSGDSAVVRWHASGDAAFGPFTIVRAAGPLGEITPQAVPPQDAVALSEQPVTAPPFEWVDHHPVPGWVNSYWVRWDATGGARYAGPASLFMPWDSSDTLPARVHLVRPNPTRTSCCFQYTQNDRGLVEVALFTAGGRAIRTLSSGSSSGEAVLGVPSELCWDGLSDAGERVASGAYMWQLRFGGERVPDQNGVVTLIR